MTDDGDVKVDQKPEIEPGFVIREQFYPFPTSYKITDPVLVLELAGLKWDPFIAAVTGDDEWIKTNEPPDETLVMAGLLGCAVWHKHPDWPRAVVVRFVQGIDEEEIDVIGTDVPETAPAEVGPGEEEPATT